MNDALLFIAITVGAYLISTVLEFLSKLFITAPKAVYGGCIAEITKIGQEARNEVAALREEAGRQLAAKDSAFRTVESERNSLRQALAAKHPRHEHLEKIIQEGLKKLAPREVAEVQRLLDAGKMQQGAFASGCHPDILGTKIGIPHLFAYDSYRPGNGSVELDRTYYINPEMKEALINVLHPPRLVTPSA